ncbi:hypothetical protein YC2023_009672 [Brassica napus]
MSKHQAIPSYRRNVISSLIAFKRRRKENKSTFDGMHSFQLTNEIRRLRRFLWRDSTNLTISPARFDDSGISPARFNDTGVRRDLAKTTRSNEQNMTISHHERSNQKNAKGRSLGSRGGSKEEWTEDGGMDKTGADCNREANS